MLQPSPAAPFADPGIVPMSFDAGSGGHRGRAAQTVCTRRVLLETVASLGVLIPLRTFADDAEAAAAAQAANDAAKLRPQTGDRLVFAAGPRSGQAIVPGDILSGSAPLSAWP